jgi:hypothetical protein
MRDRHLAGAEAVEADLVLEIDELGIGLGVEIRRVILNSCFNPSERVSVTCMASNLLLVRSQRLRAGTLSSIDPAREASAPCAGASSGPLPPENSVRKQALR